MPGFALCLFFFFNDTATTEIYTLSLHDALPILNPPHVAEGAIGEHDSDQRNRSEEHTSELQSRLHLVCRLLLEKKKKKKLPHTPDKPHAVSIIGTPEKKTS